MVKFTAIVRRPSRPRCDVPLVRALPNAEWVELSHSDDLSTLLVEVYFPNRAALDAAFRSTDGVALQERIDAAGDRISTLVTELTTETAPRGRG